jgi:hypothetical protein
LIDTLNKITTTNLIGSYSYHQISFSVHTQ